jgi:hypothetical protein
MVDNPKNEWTMNDANAFATTAIRRFCLINIAVTFLDRNPASRRVFLFVADVRYWPKADISGGILSPKFGYLEFFSP